MNQETNSPELSIVATVYNSAGIVDALVGQITNVVGIMGVTYEIILVDDGSSDDSVYVMEEQSRLDHRVKSIVLSRNFGQQIAMSAGIHHAAGRFVLIMDGDLQNPPQAISDLYQKIKEGYDIVYTTSHKKNNMIDSLTSWVFWKFLKAVMKIDIAESQLMMRVMTSRVAQYYREYPEKIRTVAAITHDIGMKRAIIPVENRRREQGKSNYNTTRRINLAIDVILDFSNQPLNFVFYFGVIVLMVTGIAMIYYLYAYVTLNSMPGFTSLILLIMLFGSINLISIGILARYMANIYTEVKRRPLYFIRKTLNLEQGS
jgi:glycosyltransferase involved in cell wall biosynthesis